MEILVAALSGSFKEVMVRLVKMISEAGSKYPVAADLVNHIVGELEGEVGDKLTPEQLRASVAEAVAILTGLNFGPPNPGAVAVT